MYSYSPDLNNIPDRTIRKLNTVYYSGKSEPDLSNPNIHTECIGFHGTGLVSLLVAMRSERFSGWTQESQNNSVVGAPKKGDLYFMPSDSCWLQHPRVIVPSGGNYPVTDINKYGSLRFAATYGKLASRRYVLMEQGFSYETANQIALGLITYEGYEKERTEVWQKNIDPNELQEEIATVGGVLVTISTKILDNPDTLIMRGDQGETDMRLRFKDGLGMPIEYISGIYARGAWEAYHLYRLFGR